MSLDYLDLSALYYEWNELDSCGQYLRAGMELSQSSGNVEFQIAALMIQARLKLALKDTAGALDAVEVCHQLEADNDIPMRTRARSAACHVEVALALNDLEGARKWAEKLETDIVAHPFYRYFGLTEARLQIAEGKMAAASRLLEKAYKTANEAGWGYGVMAVRVLQALASPTRETASEFLTCALKAAQQEGFIRTFADVGEPLVPLLQEAVLQGADPDYIGLILAAIGDSGLKSIVDQAVLVEPLSGREIEVLRLLAAGLSNRKIAEQLVISISTVKSHVHHICTKLDASNRMQAVAKARELGIIG